MSGVILPNMLNMGWVHIYIHIYPSFPEISVSVNFFNLMPKSRGWGEEGGHRKPGMREGQNKSLISALSLLSDPLRILKTVTVGNPSHQRHRQD